MKVNLFSDFTKRYQDIVVNLPEAIHDEDFDLGKLKGQDKPLYSRTL